MDGDKQAQIQYDFLTDGRNCEGPDASEIPSLAAFYGSFIYPTFYIF